MSLLRPSYLSPDRRLLADAFKAVPVGETLSFDAMSETLGAPILTRRYLIPGAIKLAAQETGAIFASVRGVGYMRLPPADAHLIGASSRRRIRRGARRAATLIEAAIQKANDVDDGARRRAFTEVSHLGLIQHIARDASAPVLSRPDAPEPVAATARQFLARLTETTG